MFATLAPPDLVSLPGYHCGQFVGPGWLRAIAPRGLVLLHLGGWWGKELLPDFTGTNLVRPGGRRRGGQLQRSFALRVEIAASAIDGKPAAIVRYGAGSPFPWPYVTDELRRLDDDHLLGMTVVPAGVLRRLPLPFLLVRTERPHGL